MKSSHDELPESIRSARDQWHWRGQARPPQAVTPGPGQVSVWDFPRPPRIVPDDREVVVRWGEIEVARTTRAVRVIETSHPPSFYLPWDDVARQFLVPAAGSSLCEWKGAAQYWGLLYGDQRLDGAAWSYRNPMEGSEALKDRVAFYARRLVCTVGGAPVQPQAGGFYGGWITPELTGPFKGEPGTESW